MSIRIYGNGSSRLSQLQPYMSNKKTGSDFAAQMEKLADTLARALSRKQTLRAQDQTCA